MVGPVHVPSPLTARGSGEVCPNGLARLARSGYPVRERAERSPSRRPRGGRRDGRASCSAGPARTPRPRAAPGSRPTRRAAARRRCCRGPRTEPGAARALGEVGRHVGPAQRFGDAVDAHLALERVPREEQCAARLARELDALARGLVGEEAETVGVDALEEHGARARPTVGGDRGHDHRVGFVQAGGPGLVVPAGEHRDRVLGEVGLVQTARGVVLASGGEIAAQVRSRVTHVPNLVSAAQCRTEQRGTLTNSRSDA
jgi:hypothetical protein